LIALKRFKDDVKEVAKGYDCGIQIKGYNDIEERDVIESYHEVAIKRNLNSIQNVYNKILTCRDFF
jgi:translation initiation factor IF-2